MPVHRPRGFVCPTCAEPLRVIRTRRAAPGLLLRRRECRTCGHRVTTRETSAPHLPPRQN